MDEEARSLLGGGLGSLGAIGTAMALVLVRGHIAPVNVALVLVLFVVLGAIAGGRGAGFVTALVAAASFDFFHTRPYGSLKIANSSDIQTTVLLLVVGLAIGEVATRADRIRDALGDNRRELKRVHRVAQLAAGGEAVDDLVSAVSAELMDTLHLHDCYFERPPFVAALPQMEPSGIVATRDHYYAKGGFELPRHGVALPVTNGTQVLGRFVLVPTPGVGVPPEHRLVAVALADQIGVVLGRTAA